MSTELAGHISSWLPGKWRSYHLTAGSSNCVTAFRGRPRTQTCPEVYLNMGGKVTTCLCFLLQSSLPGTMLRLLEVNTAGGSTSSHLCLCVFSNMCRHLNRRRHYSTRHKLLFKSLGLLTYFCIELHFKQSYEIMIFDCPAIIAIIIRV